jgi:hypothetical protein
MRSAVNIAVRDRPAFGAAFFLSAFGYEVLFFAMTLRVYDISRKAINVGLLTAITLLPKLLSPAYGLLVDRIGARRALAGASVATAILSACLSTVDALEALYALWFLLSVLFMIAANARTVLMTRVAGNGGYVGVNSIAFSLMSAARLAAPVCAAVLARSIGAGRLMIVAALAYCLCALSSALVSGDRGGGDEAEKSSGNGVRKKGREGRRGAISQLGEGFARIRASSELRLLVGVSAIRNFFIGFAPSLLIVVVAARLGRASADYGIASTASALGALVGSLAGPYLAKALRPRLVGGIGLGAHFACFAALGLVGSFTAAISALVLGNFALYAAAIVLHSRRDAATELPTRGRVYGANTTIQTLPALLSLIVGSFLADRFGVGPVFLAGGLAAMAALAAVALAIAQKAGGLSTAQGPSPSAPPPYGDGKA